MSHEHEHNAPLFRLEKPAWIVGIVGVLLMALGAFLDHDQFFRSYLFAFVFVASIVLGMLGILMIQHLTGGYWGALIRRPLQAAVRTMPLIALAFVPLLFGIHSLYEWSHAEVVAADPVLLSKASYLNTEAFIIRSAVYFLIWIAFAFFITRWSDRFEKDGSLEVSLRLRRLSALGLVVLVLSMTFASVDWMMSLEPHWFSTMYGISFAVGAALNGFALSIIIVAVLSTRPPVSLVASPLYFRDLGNLLLASVMFWAYTAFSEFMLIWYGNLREEVTWYIRRIYGGWGAIAVLLIVFHFFLPFFLLLMRQIKDRPRILAFVAGLVLFFHALDVYWLIMPAFGGHGEAAATPPFHISWMDPVALIGLLALWFAIFLGRLRARPLLPLKEPLFQEAVGHV